MRVTIGGVDSADRLLAEFTGPALVKREKAALRAAGAPLRTAIRAAAPSGPTGNLKRAIRVATLRGTPPAMIVGARRGGFRRTTETSRKPKPSAPHAHLVTGGTRPHLIAPRGKALRIGRFIIGEPVRHPGAKANPFVDRAGSAALPSAVSAYERKLLEGL